MYHTVNKTIFLYCSSLFLKLNYMADNNYSVSQKVKNDMETLQESVT